MAPVLPISVKVGQRPPGIVVDATFALSPMGLLVTMALSHSAEVWLPRGLYALLDNDAHYRRHPEEMGGASWLRLKRRDKLLAEIAVELEPWRQAWQNGRLSSRVHWLADAQYESTLPDRRESGLLPRFESCAAALDARAVANACAETPSGPLDDCARDVVALAAALQPEPTYILTLADPSAKMPPLCKYLQYRAFGPPICCHGLPDWIEAAFAPAQAPLTACPAYQAAIVQVVAPVIPALPDGWNGDDWDNDEASDGGDCALGDLWRHARILWRPLMPLEAAA